MTVKVSIFFEGNERTCGWTETLYDSTSVLTSIATKLSTYTTIRLAIAPSSVKIKGYRANVVGIRGKAITGVYTSANTGTFNGEADMTEPWSALLMTLNHLDTIRTSRFLHGIPQTQVVGGTYIPTVGFTTALTALKTEWMSNWSMYAHDPANPTNPKQAWSIDSVTTKRLTEHKVGRPFDLLHGRFEEAA